MKKAAIEISVGIFVLIGLACVAYLTIKLGKMEWLSGGHYQVSARFSSISGLKKGAIVEMAGVPIGKVAEIRLDSETKAAVVTLDIDQTVKLSNDVFASVKTSGLIGEKYIKLVPGDEEFSGILPPDGMIVETESALDIEDLIGKFAFGDAES